MTVLEILNKANSTWFNFDEWKTYLRYYDVTGDVVNLLDGLPQGTYYHPEYDALLHTFYVCRAVLELYPSDELLEAAFLHDVGKASTTNIGNKRIYHFGHPDVSAEYIDNIRDKLSFYNATRETVAKHMNKPKTPSEILFKRCDNIRSKELFLEEHSIITVWKNRIKEQLVYYKQRHAKKEIIVPVGISGSGKSTYFNTMYPPKIIVSPDNIRRELTGDVSNQSQNPKVWELTFQRLRDALEKYDRAVLDATNVAKFLRVKSMSHFNDCRKTALVFPVEISTAIKRVTGDIENKVDRSEVPVSVIEKQAKNFRRGLNSLKYEFNKVIWINGE